MPQQPDFKDLPNVGTGWHVREILASTYPVKERAWEKKELCIPNIIVYVNLEHIFNVRTVTINLY